MELKLLTEDIHKQMEGEWKEYLAETEREGWAEGYLDLILASKVWLDSNQSPSGESLHYYFALWCSDENKCWAITKVYHVSKDSLNAYYKAMSFRTSPLLDSRNGFDSQQEMERYNQVWKVLTSFIFGGIKFLVDDQHDVRQFKVYGNRQMDTAFFHHLMSALNDKKQFKNRITWQFMSLKTYQKWLDIKLI